MSNEELVQLIQQGIDISHHMEQLYLQNKGLIYKVVKKHQYACQSDYNSTPIIEMDELIHEAYFGLVKAVENYDLRQGVLFMTYATHWIGQAIKRYLDNCGRVVRVPVHTQEKIYRYNQVTSYYLQHYNREPAVREYASWLQISVKGVSALQHYMFQDKVKSLDEVLPGADGNDNMTVADTLAVDTVLEDDVVEKVAKEQLQAELWDIISSVLKDDKMVSTLCYRFKEGLTLDEAGQRLGITREMVRQYESKALRRLRTNSKSKRLVEYLL